MNLGFTAVIDLDPVDDFDCFAFTLAVDSRVTATANDGGDGRCAGGALDPEVVLYNAGETDTAAFIESNDDIDLLGDNFCAALEVGLAAGDYVACVTVSTFSSDVQLDVTSTIVAEELPPDDGGDQATATAVELPFSQNLNIVQGGDIDCFAFTTTVRGTLAFETSDGADGCPGDTQMRFFDSADTEIPFDDDGGVGDCSSLSTVQDAGAYVVCVEDNGLDNSILDVVLAAQFTEE